MNGQSPAEKNILFTICARKGSKGLRNKNISDFLGAPLVYYTLSAYDLFKKCRLDCICTLAVNTDSSILLDQINKTSVKFISIPRAESLAGDTAGKISVIKDTYIKINKKYDYVIDLDLTSPLRTADDIKGVLDGLSDGADVCFSVTNSRRSPYFNQAALNETGFYMPPLYLGASARQQAPLVFDMNASIYAYRPDFLMRAEKLFDGKCSVYKMKDTAVLDIDNPEDKELMEIIAEYFFKKYPDYAQVKDNIGKIRV